MNTTHCQICTRDIKLINECIAHHGYQRPGNGWHTASCDGAKQLPYEVSRDFIPVVIERYKVYQLNQEQIADNMFRTPQDTITRQHYNSFRKETTDEIFTKPEGFDPYDAVNKGHRAFKFASYENEFVKTYEAHRSNVKEIESSIIFLQDRYENWSAKSMAVA